MKEKILVHKVHGLCKIIEELEINGQDFLMVSSLEDNSLKIYCPKNKFSEFFRDLVSKEEATNIISYMKNLKDTHIESTKQQRTMLLDLLYSGDLKNLAYLNIALLRYQTEKAKRKQLLSTIESKVLKASNKMLVDELSFSLDISKDKLNSDILVWASNGSN